MSLRVVAISFITALLFNSAASYAQAIPARPGRDSQEMEALNSLKNESVDKLRGLDRLQAIKESPKFINDAGLSCEMTDARDAGSGTTYLDGKNVNIRSYEVACSNGVGYILVSKNRGPATALSCFSFLTTESVPATQNRHQLISKDQVSCHLPANKDVYAMAANLLSSLSTACKVTGVSSFGLNNSNKTEYVEVACENNVGYVLAIPQQIKGANQLTAMSCQDASRHKLDCKLTKAGAATGPAPVTMQTLYDALKQNGITCSSTQLQLRMIGRESIKKRYVVETQCPDRQVGLISYIPINDETNKFETIDCNEGAKRQIACQLGSK